MDCCTAIPNRIGAGCSRSVPLSCNTSPFRCLWCVRQNCDQQDVRDIMWRRVEKAASMACDGIEPDHMSVRKCLMTERLSHHVEHRNSGRVKRAFLWFVERISVNQVSPRVCIGVMISAGLGFCSGVSIDPMRYVKEIKPLLHRSVALATLDTFEGGLRFHSHRGRSSPRFPQLSIERAARRCLQQSQP